MHCPHCGCELQEAAASCIDCGRAIAPGPRAATLQRRGDPDYPGLGQAVWLILLFLLAFIAIAIVEEVLERLGLDLSLWIDLAASNVVAVGLVLLWAARRTGLPALQVLRFTAFPPLLIAPLLLFTLGGGVVLSEVDNLLRWFLPVPVWLQEVFLDLMGGGWTSFVSLVVVAPLTEELLFRGVILRGLIAHRGVRSAVLWSSLLFGMVHMNPWQFVSAVPVGIVLGWLFVQSRSLYPCILLHAAFNATAFVIGGGHAEAWGLSVPGLMNLPWQPHSFQPPALDLFGLVLAVGSLLWMKRIFEQEAKRALARV